MCIYIIIHNIQWIAIKNKIRSFTRNLVELAIIVVSKICQTQKKNMQSIDFKKKSTQVEGELFELWTNREGKERMMGGKYDQRTMNTCKNM